MSENLTTDEGTVPTSPRLRPVALVTGATAGIGRQFADQLAASGHDLILVARDATRLSEIAADLGQRFGITAEVLPANLTDPQARLTVEQRLRTTAVDVLVNNAGFGIRAPFDRSDIADEQRILDVMVTAVMRLTHAAIPGMVARGRGSILVVSSVAGWTPTGTYASAKAWATTFSQGLHAPLRRQGVVITAVCPGFTHTEFHKRAGMDLQQIPNWMWLDSSDVVRRALRDNARGRSLSVAGAQYRLLSFLARHAPRSLVARAAQW